MTQRNVERLLGRLLTDEALRDQFVDSPERTLMNFIAEGLELSWTEYAALAALDRESLVAFAAQVDPRIRKASLNSGAMPVMSPQELQSSNAGLPHADRDTRKEQSP